jgi:outer membrane lipase/esterase
MKHWFFGRALPAFTFAAVAFASVPAAATMVVFGDSLSDSGNAAIAIGSDPGQVITGNSYIPSHPYASGTFSNGPVWASDVALALGVPLQPSLAGGTNFAVGGATTGGSSPTSLLAQVSQYLTLTGGLASSTALYVVEGGGNDGFAALSAIAGGGNPATIIAATAASFASNIGTIVSELKAGGAGQIDVWNTPNLGLTPAIMALGPGASFLGTLLATQMNLALAAALAGDTGVSIFDIYGLGTSIAANPAAFGLVNVTDACGAPAACDPATAQYWDGIHPTATAHTLIADAFLAEAVPEPSTWAMMLLGFVGLGFVFRQSRRRVLLKSSDNRCA